MAVASGDVDPALLDRLRELGNAYGPLGVALAAMKLSDPHAVVRAAMDPRRAEEFFGSTPAPAAAPAEAGVYRERAALVAYFAAIYPSAIVHGADPENPGWPVIYVDSPKGQLSWHLSGGDLDLFPHVPVVEGDRAPVWDGHSTAEKYERIAELVRDLGCRGKEL